MKRFTSNRTVSGSLNSSKLEFTTEDFEEMSTDEKLIVLRRTVQEMHNLLTDLASSNALDDWIDQKQAEALTGLSTSTLYNLRQRGDITSSSFTGKEVFYRRSDLIRYLDYREKMRA